MYQPSGFGVFLLVREDYAGSGLPQADGRLQR
jgi:hypothetical protein